MLWYSVISVQPYDKSERRKSERKIWLSTISGKWLNHRDMIFSHSFRNPSARGFTRAQLEADILCEVSSRLDICWYCYLYFVNNDSEEWAPSWACSPLLGATRWLLNLFSLKIKSSRELFVWIIVIFTCYLCQEDPGSSLITKLRRDRVLRVVPQRL